MTRKVGRGKYSEVFEGIDIRTNDLVVIKVRPSLLALARLTARAFTLADAGRILAQVLKPIKKKKASSPHV